AHVAAALPDLGNDTLVAALIDRLKARGQVVADARTVALKGFEPRLSQGERRLKSDLAEALRAGGVSPPQLAHPGPPARGPGPGGPGAAGRRALLRDGERAAEIPPQLSLAFEAAARLRRLVADRLSGGATLTMAELRDLLGTTRKYAVPIGEYLDRIGLTLRDGDLRLLGDAAPPNDAPASAPR